MNKHDETIKRIEMIILRPLPKPIDDYFHEMEQLEKNYDKLKSLVRLYLGYVSYDVDQTRDGLDLAKELMNLSRI